MLENKVLVSVSVPQLENKYDIYIPVNRKIHNVIGMIKNILHELSQGSFDAKSNYMLYDRDTGTAYNMNILVRDSDIRNGSKLILL